MSAAPRTMRAVSIPSNTRLRRVANAGVRPVGTISVFLAATAILGLTSLGYLWQSGQALKAGVRVHMMEEQLQGLDNTTKQLQSQIASLQSYGIIIQSAYTKYGMRNVDPSIVHAVRVPAIAITRIVAVPAPAAHPATTHLRLAGSDAAVTSWWQDAWVVLYGLLR